MIFPILVQTPTLDLTFQPSGVVEKIGGYAPFGVKLSATRPEGLKKAPEATAPKYGTIKVGGREFLLLIDGKSKVFVDSNADGDLTNDPATVWEEKAYKSSGQEVKSHSGFATVDLGYGGKTYPSRIGLYETGEADDLGFYADFALVGTANLGGKAYPAILVDPTLAFDYGAKYGPLLLVDKDGSGTFHPGFEFNATNEPFNIGGTTYELKTEGGKPVIIKSEKTVAERLVPTEPVDPNLENGLTPGKAALKFEGTTMSGKAISFPDTYKGKVVMVDFWATWCGPCMREVPNLAKVYTKYKDQGFEVLGVTLDNPDMTAKIQDVTAKNGMTWEQIYDGKAWQAAIAQQYGIKAIPATYLVDGDTGEILAISDALRGESLDATVAKALAAKKAKG